MTEIEAHAPKFDELEIVELEGVSGGGRHGLNVVDGSANKNAALGRGSKDSQQVFIGAQ
jgi:hypothetical protein